MGLLLNKLLISAIIFMIAIGCATTPRIDQKSGPQVDSNKKEKMTAEELLADVNREFMTLIEDAREKGPHAVNYLITDFFVKANDASIRGDSQTAVFLYKYLVELDRDSSYLKKKYAIELVKVSELDEAESVLESLYKEEKLTDIDVGLMLGGIQITKNEIVKARKSYLDVLKIDKSHVEACIFLAKTYVSEKKYKESKKIIRGCEKRSKKNPIYRLFLGSIAAEEKNIPLARKRFQEALKIKPDYYKAVLAIGATYEQDEKYKKATAEYKKFLKNHPDNFYILSQVVQTMFASGKLEGIIPYLEKLVEQDSSDLNSKVKLGVLYTEKKNYKMAQRVFKEILMVVPDSDKILYSLGSIGQITGEADSAIEYFSKITTDSDLYNDSTLQVSKMLQVRAINGYLKGNKELAKMFIAYIDGRINENGPYFIELAVIKAGFYDETRRSSIALSIVEKLEAHNNFNDAHAYYLASLYDREQKREESRTVIKKIIERDPKNAHALNFLGYSLLEYEDKSRWPEAYTYISRAVELSPHDGYIRDSLGWYYYRNEEYQKAKVEIYKAWNVEKKDPIIGKHLSLVYQELKEYDKAREYLVEALQYCTEEDQKALITDALKDLDSMMRLPASK